VLFLADENVPRQIIERLRADGHTVTAVRDTTPQATDDVVLSDSNRMGAVLLTIDKDFGELTFRLGKAGTGIALLRLEGISTAGKAEIVSAAVKTLGERMAGSFVVIAPGRLRLRSAGDA
jgi:predicted nuclease of predicted toxin-antitoxin system